MTRTVSLLRLVGARRIPRYKPEWHPHGVRDAFRALGRTLREYALLMRLHRPIGIWLLLWPALWGLWIAGAGRPDARLLVIFVAGVVVTRSAGCVINDYADRDLDPKVARTRDRPLAARRVAPAEALFLFVALGFVAVWLALQLDPYAQLFAVAGGLLAVTYPWLKRIVHVPQFYLGVAFGWSIPMAFAALDRRRAEDRLAPADRRRALGRRLRHDVCDGRSRGRRAHRRQVDRHPFRRGRPVHHCRDAGDDAVRTLACRQGSRARRLVSRAVSAPLRYFFYISYG